LAKPGLDGHDRGIKVVGMALRDAGVEVVYLGLRQSVASILSAAEQEDVDAIGLSILSGVHLAITGKLLAERENRGLSSIAIFVGGTIPPTDRLELLGMGVAGVYPVGTDLDEMVEEVRLLAAAARKAHA
jgi:methylmalonyl-CoA mutase C-terminal domain/subunit